VDFVCEFSSVLTWQDRNIKSLKRELESHARARLHSSMLSDDKVAFIRQVTRSIMDKGYANRTHIETLGGKYARKCKALVRFVLVFVCLFVSGFFFFLF
jgi:hypothetical protein